MGSVPDEAVILDAARALAGRGLSLHWLKRRSKRPINDKWSQASAQSFDDLRATYHAGFNLGLRPGEWSLTEHGYLHIIDMDVRDEAQVADALATLAALWPGYTEAPFVISGSGGSSRHFYFFTDKPFRGRKLARSDGFEMVFDAELGREVKRRDWEIELFGTGKQVAVPPSVHRVSGEPYRWGRAINWDLLDLGVGPILPAEVVTSWGAPADVIDEDDDLLSMLRSEPMGLSEQEIDSTLADLPPEWVEDRDTWRDVGMALHHEYRGVQAGFDRWCEWSKVSAKFNMRDSAAVWKSFGKEHVRNPIRMATLIKAAADHRLAEAHADLDLLADLDDPLTGTALAVFETPVDEIDLLADLGIAHSIAPGASVGQTLTYDEDWRSHFHRNEEGAIRPTLHNVKLILRNDMRLRGVIAMNRFTQEPVMIREPGRLKRNRERPKPIVQLEGFVWTLRDPINGNLWSDSHDAAVRAMIEAPETQGGYGIKVSDRDMKASVDIVAMENGFHPIKQYLEATAWDGVTRVERLFLDYVGSPDDPYHREAALLWLIGAVARIYEPGHKFDFVPILEGMQGKRKSTFFLTLARHWSAELEGDFHDKKAMVEQMQGAWIIEMPELQGFSKAEVTTIKGFVSRTKDKVRLSYGRRAAEFPRQCVFGGTTNEEEYLRDATGGRRFWPIECRAEEIDIARLEREVDQIWAEALHLYRLWRQQYPAAQLPLYMKNESSSLIAKSMQESRRQVGADEVLAAQIEDWLEQPIGSELGLDDADDAVPEYRTETCLLEIWTAMLGKDSYAYTDRDQAFLGRAMRKVKGWGVSGARRRFPNGIGQQRVYAKIFYAE